jgi:uncharacterized protein YecE (DUF72 family)
VRIGCAGWTIPKQFGAAFPTEGSHLFRYAQRFNAVEINSSFYRPHRRSTYERWAAGVPDDFLFAVKIPREITHKRKLVDVDEPLVAFFDQAQGLGAKLGPLLVQLPPSLQFDPDMVRPFFTTLRAAHAGEIVCEPRHATWFTPEGEALLVELRVARVAADPAVLPHAAIPGGWNGLRYMRLHGAPRVYYSDYAADQLADVAHRLADAPTPTWCIFDNTALGHAVGNALALREMVASPTPAPRSA